MDAWSRRHQLVPLAVPAPLDPVAQLYARGARVTQFLEAAAAGTGPTGPAGDAAFADLARAYEAAEAAVKRDASPAAQRARCWAAGQAVRWMDLCAQLGWWP